MGISWRRRISVTIPVALLISVASMLPPVPSDRAAADDSGAFSAMFMSDSQFPWWFGYDNQSDNYVANKSLEANIHMISAMNGIDALGSWPTSAEAPDITTGGGDAIPRPEFAVLNGDLTAYWHWWHRKDYLDMYGHLQYLRWEGLGNHDYANNANAGDIHDIQGCSSTLSPHGDAWPTRDNNACAKDAISYMAAQVDTRYWEQRVRNMEGRIVNKDWPGYIQVRNAAGFNIWLDLDYNGHRQVHVECLGYPSGQAPVFNLPADARDIKLSIGACGGGWRQDFDLIPVRNCIVVTGALATTERAEYEGCPEKWPQVQTDWDSYVFVKNDADFSVRLQLRTIDAACGVDQWPDGSGGCLIRRAGDNCGREQHLVIENNEERCVGHVGSNWANTGRSDTPLPARQGRTIAFTPDAGYAKLAIYRDDGDPQVANDPLLFDFPLEGPGSGGKPGNRSYCIRLYGPVGNTGWEWAGCPSEPDIGAVGSLSYSWEKGDYHFVQLHNRPGYFFHYVGEDDPSWPSLLIRQSYDWLKQDVADATARGKKIVLNMHDFNPEDPRLMDAIANQNVVAIFGGHHHFHFGYRDTIDNGLREIEWWDSGSAECRTFLLATFHRKYINVSVVKAEGGTPAWMLDPDRCDRGFTGKTEADFDPNNLPEAVAVNTTKTVGTIDLNLDPTVTSVEVSPQPLHEGETATFSADAHDADGDPLSYAWSFGDRTASVEASPKKVFGDEGTYTASVTVDDSYGGVVTTSEDITVKNVAPMVSSLQSSAPQDEGSSVTLSGTVIDPGWEDALSGTIDWGDASSEPISGTLENIAPDATLTFSATHTYGDNVDPYTVKVCVDDGDWGEGCDEITVSIANVDPDLSIDPRQVTAIDEGESLGLLANFSDEGWLDTHMAVIDWGESTVEVGTTSEDPDNKPAPGTGTVTGNHRYGDNGSFSVSSLLSDDEHGSDSASFTVDVVNVDPSAVIDTAGSTSVNGRDTFLARVGETVPFSANSKDPGSDDLTMTWDWDDGGAVPDLIEFSPVNPPGFDLSPSPTVQPRDETNLERHAFGVACLYAVGFGSADDDGGARSDTVPVVIQGNETTKRPSGYWLAQYGKQKDFSEHELECFLAIAEHTSLVFNDARDAATIPAAHDVLLGGGSALERLDRTILASLLNFAAGSTDWDETIEGSTFHDALAAAESVRLDPTSSDTALIAAKQDLSRFNLPK